MIRSRSLAISLFAIVLCAPASAGETPLEELPADKLAALAPLLRSADLALIESRPDGRMKQVTVMSLVAAPPEIVRKVLTTPEEWHRFASGITQARVKRNPDGSIDSDFAMSLGIVNLESNSHLVVRKDGSVRITDRGPADPGTQLFQLIPVAEGTVLVQYGYMNVLHGNRLLQRVVAAARTAEHGLGLSAQLAWQHAMKTQSEKLARLESRSPPINSSKARGPGFHFLLERGEVAVIRSAPDGKLGDISVVERVRAPASRVLEVLSKPGEFRTFVDGVKESREDKRSGGEVTWESDFDFFLVGFSSRFTQRIDGNAVDVFGVSGDFRGARYRWDLTERAPDDTLAVYRANQDLAAASPIVLGTLFKLMPMFEHGIAVAIGLVYVTGVRARAEGRR